MKRQRRETPAGEYTDPLKRYDPPVYEDGIERAMCEDKVTDVQTRPFTVISPDATVREAMETMDRLKIAFLVITEGDRLVGLFSERDVLIKVAEQYDRVKDLPVRTVMTIDPLVAYETDSPAKVLNQMAVGGFRHVPILSVDEKVVGIIGPRRVTAYLQKKLQIEQEHRTQVT